MHAEKNFEQMNKKNRFKGHYTFYVDGMCSERKFISKQENTAYHRPNSINSDIGWKISKTTLRIMSLKI